MKTQPAPLSGSSRRVLFGLSPWLPVGLAAVLGLAIFAMSMGTRERERESMTRSLVERAEAFILALEAGTRTWLGFEGESALLQHLVMETARQPGVEYLAVTDADGKAIVHSDSEQVGETVHDGMPIDADAAPRWRIRRENGRSIFEVYRRFAPLSETIRESTDHHGRMGMGHGMGRGPMWRRRMAEDRRYDNTVVHIAFDHEPYEAAMAADLRSNLVSAGMVAALALGGFVSLFWAHGYRRSRRLLLDAEALASEVVTSLPLGLMTVGPDGRVGTINDRALDMLAVARGDAEGAALASLPGPDWETMVQAMERGEKIVERESEFFTADGRRVSASLGASRIETSEGEFIGRLFILRDLNEVKKLREKAERNDRLAALGALAAGVAHEIRNPLSSIKGLATFLAHKVPPGGREEEAAQSMVEETNRLNRVVSELLEFARQGKAKPEPADMNGIVENVLRLADADIRARGVRVEFAPAPALPPAPANPGRMTQALLNLVLNAVQAMDAGGALGVATSGSVEKGFVAVSVSDTGCGMTGEVREAAFNPYFTTKPTGTGLGLAIVKQIVEEHAGTITLKSSPGAGSVFTITLPLE